MSQSLSIAGAVKALIVASDDVPFVGGNVYRWNAPDAAVEPYVVLIPDMADPPSLKGDQKVLARTRMLQVDLWETYDAEDDDLLMALCQLLDGVKLTCGTDVLRCRVNDSVKLPDDEHRQVHSAITLHVTYLTGAG
jgi:hypothetical protein